MSGFVGVHRQTTDLIKSDNCMQLRIIKLHNFVANNSV